MPKLPQSYLDARRNEILDAAWTCFARTGYRGTTMQDICRESQLSPGAIYRYFESKEQILRAISERSLTLSRELVNHAREHTDRPLESLRMVGRTMLGAFAHPLFETMTRVNIELWPEIIRDESLGEGMRAEVAFWHEAVSQIFAEAGRQGQLKEGVDPKVAAALIICAYEGLRHYNLIAPEIFKPEVLLSLGEMFSADDRTVDPSEFMQSPETAGLPLGTKVQRRPGRTAKAAHGDLDTSTRSSASPGRRSGRK